ARLRLLGREPAARALRAGRGSRRDRLPAALVRTVVVGGGAWGTAFAQLVRERGHEVTLAVRDASREYAYGLDATPLADAPYEEAELVVVAVPSRAFREVVEALPGSAPVLSLTKGLDPATGERLSTLVRGRDLLRHVRPGEHRDGDRERGRGARAPLA